MKLHNITKIYHNKNKDVIALNDVSLDLNRLGITMILGSSGCGKTTLLNIISGLDKDYTGQIDIQEHMEYIQQDFQLFESLSVMDNLLLASEDQKKIEHYLEKFQLVEHKHKKVKKLSNGQKKRVQILRSLLLDPQTLLCDEPTAALDHENTEIIMNVLKEISQNASVIIVTHEIALVENYADYLIEIEKGIISSQKEINKKEEKITKGKESIQKTTKQHVRLGLKTMMSRPIESIVLVLFILLLGICIYGSSDIFSSLNKGYAQKQTWYYGENLVLSQPQQFEYITDNTIVYEDFDTFTRADIDKLKEEIPEILAYTNGWERERYRGHANDGMGSFKPYFEEGFKQIILQSSADGTIVGGYAFPSDPYLFTDKERATAESRVIPYQLVNNEIPLLYGEQPKEDMDIVISQDFAHYLLAFLEATNIQDLIGKELILYTSDANSDVFNEGNDNTSFHTKITGITEYQNRNEKQVFFRDEVYTNEIIQMYEMNEDKMGYEYLNVLLDPDADAQSVVEKMNEIIPNSLTKFKVNDGSQYYNEYGETKDDYYQQFKNFYLYCFLLFIIIFVIYLSLRRFYTKRQMKEHAIVKQYGYTLAKYENCLTVMYTLLGAVILIIGMPFICNVINMIMHQMGYGNVIKFNILSLLATILIIFVFTSFSDFILVKKK